MSRHKVYCAAANGGAAVGGEVERITVSGLREGDLDAIRRAVASGRYRSTSHFVCAAVRRGLARVAAGKAL